MIAEKAVIGAALLGGGWVVDESRLTVDDFFEGKCAKLWGFISARHAEGVAVDTTLVLSAMPELSSFVFECTSACPAVSSAEFYAAQVREASLKRRMAALGSTIASTALLADTKGDLLVEQVYRDLDGLVASRATDEVAFMFEGLDDYLAGLRSVESNASCGLPNLDGLLNGFRPGALYVIGARPAVGKTVVGLQVALGLARNKSELPDSENAGVVGFFSLEMSKRELMNRIVAQTFEIEMNRIDRKELASSEFKLIEKYRHMISKPLTINDRSGQSMASIKNYCRSIVRSGGKLKAIVIDYLGLIADANNGRNRYEAMTAVSGALKAMAKDFNVPVIALAQLNRAIESRKDDSPIMADLRDSGSIEQDADVVMLLNRRMGEGSRGSWDLNVMEIAIVKNRHGQTGLLNYSFEGKFSRIVEPKV